jgi:2-(1,2-epoxy-1,2-dihydrophenyl)acetyl-CoA isomerase
MAMLGERIPAERALEWGMVNRVVADGELEGAVSELASRLAAGPPGSYAAIKNSINRRMYEGFADVLELEAALQQQRVESKDFMEGVLSFLQKRAPEFTGE